MLHTTVLRQRINLCYQQCLAMQIVGVKEDHTQVTRHPARYSYDYLDDRHLYTFFCFK